MKDRNKLTDKVTDNSYRPITEPDRTFNNISGNTSFNNANNYIPKSDVRKSNLNLELNDSDRFGNTNNINPYSDSNPYLSSSSKALPVFGNKISPEEESIFSNFLRNLLEVEICLEKSKTELCLRADFNIEDAFSIFDRQGKGYVTKDDFFYALQSLNITTDKKTINLFYNRYDVYDKGVLGFNEFFDMLIPFKKSFRNDIQNRIRMTYTPKYNKEEVFLLSTKLYLQNVLRNIQNGELNLDEERKKISSVIKVIIGNIFNKIDENRKGYIIPSELGKYMQSQGITILEEDSDLLFIRLDKDKDGQVKVEDILLELKPILN